MTVEKEDAVRDPMTSTHPKVFLSRLFGLVHQVPLLNHSWKRNRSKQSYEVISNSKTTRPIIFNPGNPTSTHSRTFSKTGRSCWYSMAQNAASSISVPWMVIGKCTLIAVGNVCLFVSILSRKHILISRVVRCSCHWLVGVAWLEPRSALWTPLTSMFPTSHQNRYIYPCFACIVLPDSSCKCHSWDSSLTRVNTFQIICSPGKWDK